MVHKIKHNDLLPWFLEDHSQLPEAYVKSCQKFFDAIRESSHKHQAASLPQSGDIVLTTKGKNE
jgi:lipoate-protein ligase A|tara:strand:- start:308 stop:499 length:192 start_codon:yes stop_codon:yes gene_type:complete